MTSLEENETPNENENDDPKKDDCILNHMEISIAESEKRNNTSLNIREFYTVYLIETKVTDDNWSHLSIINKTSMVWRRYSEFEMIRTYLQDTYPYVILPPLPEKKPTYVWRQDNSSIDITDPDFVDRRRACLENFLHRISSHSVLSYNNFFLSFLRQESGWKETLNHQQQTQQSTTMSTNLTTNSLSNNNSLIISNKYFLSSSSNSFNQNYKIKYPNKKLEKILIYSENLNKNMNSILKIRCKMANKLYALHKIHEHYGKVLCEWSAIEKEMGDGLQKSGHFFDSIAEFIVPALEDEEIIADQLKEYLFFAESLNNLYKKYELIQHQLETSEELLETKKNEKLKLEQGKTSFLLKLFGTSIDNEDVRDNKLSLIENKINEIEFYIEENKCQINNFIFYTLEEYSKFEQIKYEDLKQTLKQYITLQIRIQQKCLNIWNNIRQCVHTIP